MSPLISLPDQETPLSDGMYTEWNGKTYTQYAREPMIEAPATRRTSSIRRRSRSASLASGGSMPRGGSNPPPVRREEASIPVAAEGRVYGAIDLPEGPIYVRKPPERPVRDSLQRKVSLRRNGPRIGLILLVIFTVLLAGTISSWYYLTQSQEGHALMAVWGWSNAPVEAFWRLGESKMREGYVAEALEAFIKAHEGDIDRGITNNIEGILALANAYERDGQGDKAKELYEDLIGNIARNHPDAYIRLYHMYKDKGDHANAVAMLELGHKETSLDTFTRLIREYSPDQPYASNVGGRFNREVRITLRAAEGTTIYYTVDHYPQGDMPIKKSALKEEEQEQDDKNPLPERDGILYVEGEEILLNEGTTYVRAVAVQDNDVPSKEMEETYAVVFPIPDPPKANVSSGTYDYAPTVSLRADKGIAAIHYTIDNTTATQNSPLYTGPIKLPNGRTFLRAIAVDHRGKPSYEMNIEYMVRGATKKMFNSNDVFDKLSLLRTTYDQFTRAYGKPRSYEKIEGEWTSERYRADYPFGYASFVQADNNRMVLYELMVESGNIRGPRNIRIGDSQDKVITGFNDRGGQAMKNGERLLYNNNLNSIGVYQLTEDGNFAARYYHPRANKKNEFVELSFYFRNGQVSRMHWLWYIGNASN